MQSLVLLSGTCLFALSLLFRSRLDAELPARLGALSRKLRALWAAAPAPDEDLRLTGRLISSLHAGLGLDAALEAIALEAPPGSPLRARLRGTLEGRPPPDFLSQLLASALRTGTPVLSSLQNLERAFRARRKSALRAAAASSNCRAQAEILSWLPWALAAGIAIIDGNWFLAASRDALSWFLWALALLLAGSGRAWIRRAVDRALRPTGATERLEEEVLPDFVLRVTAEIARGVDIESATESCLRGNGELARAYAADSSPGDGSLNRLRSTLRHAARTGAPVRQELAAFLEDLQANLESRWEERVQRLPVTLLAPLFACFLPSSLLVLAGLLLPVLRPSL
jgi:hypothetical protein